MSAGGRKGRWPNSRPAFWNPLAQNGLRGRPPCEDQSARISILAQGHALGGRIRFCRLLRPATKMPLADRAGHTFCRHRAAVERGPVPTDAARRLQPIQQHPMQLCPHACRLPVAQAPPTGHARPAAHLHGQTPPGRAGRQHEQDAGQGGPVRHARTTALGARRIKRQQRQDRRPQLIRDKRLAHAPSTPSQRSCYAL